MRVLRTLPREAHVLALEQMDLRMPEVASAQHLGQDAEGTELVERARHHHVEHAVVVARIGSEEETPPGAGTVLATDQERLADVRFTPIDRHFHMAGLETAPRRVDRVAVRAEPL